MTHIIKTIPNMDVPQLEQLVLLHQAAARTANTKSVATGRSALARADGFSEAAETIGESIAELMDRTGFTAGRLKAVAALRWAALAEQFHEALNDDEFEALTGPFNAAVLVAA